MSNNKEVKLPKGFSIYDASDYLNSDEKIIAVLNDALDELYKGDREYFYIALADVAKAKGIKNIAEKTGLNRESLYKTISGERSSKFESILKILHVLNIDIEFKVAS